MNCIIIEDEIPSQRILQNYISKLPDLHLIASFQSALEANSTLQNSKIDLVFLDINLPDISGIQYLKTLTTSPAIVMTTAYHEHAVVSFELDSIYDYLVKPFSFERFLKAVNKVKKYTASASLEAEQNENASKTLLLNVDKTLHKIHINDILFIVSDRNYVTVTTKKGKFSYLDSLKNLMGKLPKDHFVQVHKSFIINFTEIEKISGNVIYLNREKIPIGRTFKTSLLKMLYS